MELSTSGCAKEISANLIEQAEATFRAARAAATVRAYEHDWRAFQTWCGDHRLAALPANPQTVILYLTDLAKNQGRKWNTVSRRVAALSQLHRQAGLESPVRTWPVKQFLAGLRRELGVAPAAKRPLLIADLKAILANLPDSVAGCRDRALLLLGFAAALRRSEVAALDREDLEPTREGLILHLRRSKTDPEGQGRRIGIPRGREPGSCPVEALQAWCSAASIDSGPVFRPINRHGQVLARRITAESVALVVKRYVARIGLDPRCFGGHSLRAGLATSAAAAGKPERAIMNQTGHRSLTTLRRYIREGQLFRENAADGLGL